MTEQIKGKALYYRKSAENKMGSIPVSRFFHAKGYPRGYPFLHETSTILCSKFDRLVSDSVGAKNGVRRTPCTVSRFFCMKRARSCARSSIVSSPTRSVQKTVSTGHHAPSLAFFNVKPELMTDHRFAAFSYFKFFYFFSSKLTFFQKEKIL